MRRIAPRHLSRIIATLSLPGADPSPEADPALTALTFAWRDVVGTLIATHSQPCSLDDGVLTLSCSEPAIASELWLRERDLCHALSQRGFRVAAIRIRSPRT